MDRYWLLTSTFYGNWLPGDPRGFVARVREVRPEDVNSSDTRGADAAPLAGLTRHMHDQPGTPYDRDFPGLQRSAREKLKSDPIRLNREQAEVLLAQFQETARHRGWQLLAVAVMPNHIHIVIGVIGDPDPTKILAGFKAYGSRALNQNWGKPACDTWWTSGGSKRKLPDRQAVRKAIDYVRRQSTPLLIWLASWAA